GGNRVSSDAAVDTASKRFLPLLPWPGGNAAGRGHGLPALGLLADPRHDERALVERRPVFARLPRPGLRGGHPVVPPRALPRGQTGAELACGAAVAAGRPRHAPRGRAAGGRTARRLRAAADAGGPVPAPGRMGG